MKYAALLVLVALVGANGHAVELDADNFDAKIAETPNWFIKFLAPWWGHCKRMKPDWDKLGAEFEGSNVLIGDVDCTADNNRDLCSKYGVSGYPTIKYNNMDTEGDQGEAYQGGRDFDSLKSFVEESLAKKCEVEDQKDCDEREVKYIEKMKTKGPNAVKKQLDRLTKMKAGDNKMKADLKKWMMQRLSILEQM